MSKRVLVVDCNTEERRSLCDVLSANGYQVTVTACTREGLDVIRTQKPDLVALEMDMPSPGGTIFYARMRRDPELRHTPVVVVSSVGPRPAALRKGVPVVQRPAATGVLLDTVSRAMAV
ncbi:response regulator [Oleidesulfovibrio alaskensis]|uniref:response regulator n=1 Tax=Oleidesulfovibrio alaskensis TaxID=58180 RepID=UPI001E176679|nr:response regulator [Oleidesulfovibrio alaskensis]MBG0773030.1 response regulator [Oleidesulfovibrio alaskensis]